MGLHVPSLAAALETAMRGGGIHFNSEAFDNLGISFAGDDVLVDAPVYDHGPVPNDTFFGQTNGIIFFKDAAGVVTRIAPPA